MYYIVDSTTIRKDLDLYIPVDANNADYQEYLAWVAAGNTASPFVPPAGDDVLQVFSNVSVGTSTIFDGTSGRILYNNAGVLGELSSSGTGNVLRASGATATSLTLAGTLTASSSSGTNGQLLQSTGSGVQWYTPLYAPLFSQTFLTPTTSDVTAIVDSINYVDVSGMTANRTLTLPSTPSIGQRCVVYISSGNATYSLIVNSGSTEVARLFITGECLTFAAVDTGSVFTWMIENDGRKPCVARVTYSGTAQSFTTATTTTVTLNSSSFDNASLVNTANSQIKIRRTGRYVINAGLRLATISATIPRFFIAVRETSPSNYLNFSECSVSSSTTQPALSFANIVSVSEGKILELQAFQNSGSNATSSVNSSGTAGNAPFLAIQEILI